MFVSLPDYPRIEVWKQDRLNKLAAAASLESGGKARARYALSRFNIKAAAFKQLVSTIDLQNAFITLLNHWEGEAWINFTGVGIPKEIFPRAGHHQLHQDCRDGDGGGFVRATSISNPFAKRSMNQVVNHTRRWKR